MGRPRPVDPRRQDSLQNGGRCDEVGSGFRFELLGSAELDSETQDEIIRSGAKVECVFQIVQQLIVDSHKSGVLCIAPPILTRSFQELGGALIAYHEAKKLSFVPLPLAYKAGPLVTHERASRWATTQRPGGREASTVHRTLA